VVVVDEATTWWAWRHVPRAIVNTGSTWLIGDPVDAWVTARVSGRFLDLVGLAVLIRSGSVHVNLADGFIAVATLLYLVARPSPAATAGDRTPCSASADISDVEPTVIGGGAAGALVPRPSSGRTCHLHDRRGVSGPTRPRIGRT